MKTPKKTTPKLSPVAKTTLLRDRPNWLHRIWRLIEALFGLVVLVLTLIGGYAVICPRVSIEPPNDPVDPYDYYSPPFTLKNNGWLFPIYDVEVVCKPSLSGPFSDAKPFNIKFKNMIMGLEADKISSGVERNIICSGLIMDIRTSGDIRVTKFGVSMEVTFRPIWFIPYTASRSFNFTLDLEGSNRLRWMRPQLEIEKEGSSQHHA